MRCYMPLRLTIGTLEHTYQSLFQSDFRAATESISMASMTKNQVLGIPGHEKVFIRKALGQRIRIDGRGPNEFREVEVTLSRSELSATATVVIGNTRVVSVVSGEITAPYPDRPTEGIIQFNAEVSPMAEAHGVSQVQLSRLLDRSIRESDAIDTESLCIISGERVWLISCDVRVLDFSGGNVVDTALFAAISALKAFKKPEISIVSVAGKSALSVGDITIHRSDEREPLPLALHHTPLSVSLGIFGKIKSTIEGDEQMGVVLVADPSAAEEASMDGSLTFSINAHKELCAIHKPGKVAVTADVILKAAKIASDRAEILHSILKDSLAQLEVSVIAERTVRLEKTRALRESTFDSDNIYLKNQKMDITEGGEDFNGEDAGAGGISRDDPMLAWTSLHQAAGLREVN